MLLLRSRKGLSNVIAVMILIAISVTGSFLLYAYAAGVFGSLQAGQPKQSYLDQIALEYYDWTDPSVLKLQVRNVGSANIQIVDIFISGTRVTTVNWGTCTSGSLPVQASCFIQLTTPSSLLPTLHSGYAYPVSIITSSGGKITFSALVQQSG